MEQQQQRTQSRSNAFRRCLLGFAGVFVALGAIGASPGNAEAYNIRQVQWNLAVLDYMEYGPNNVNMDGINGPITTKAVSAYQYDRCLSPDGVAGPITQRSMSALVKIVQAKAGMKKAERDGLGGVKTKRAIKRYQKGKGLRRTGQADAATMRKMGITRSLTCPGGPRIAAAA